MNNKLARDQYVAIVTNSDPCPVCCQNSPAPANTYCSNRCRIIAYNFRKRIADPVRFLKSIGFTCEYSNGVQLYITLPEALRVHYPHNLTKFDFPNPCLDINELNANHLWETIRFQLGYMVTGTLRFLSETDYFKPESATEMMLHAINEAKFDLGCHFWCEKCKRQFVKTARSQVVTEKSTLCSDCAINALPF